LSVPGIVAGLISTVRARLWNALRPLLGVGLPMSVNAASISFWATVFNAYHSGRSQGSGIGDRIALLRKSGEDVRIAPLHQMAVLPHAERQTWDTAPQTPAKLTKRRHAHLKDSYAEVEVESPNGTNPRK
jgi:hypothetical protein